MKIQTFINEFKLTFVYDLLRQTLTDEQLFEHSVENGQVIWFKEQMRQMWLMLEKAKAQAVPEGFVLINAESLAFHAKSIRMFNDGDSEHQREEIEDHVCSIEAMIEVQEPTND